LLIHEKPKIRKKRNSRKEINDVTANALKRRRRMRRNDAKGKIETLKEEKKTKKTK
jgi:hypothetical protein